MTGIAVIPWFRSTGWAVRGAKSAQDDHCPGAAAPGGPGGRLEPISVRNSTDLDEGGGERRAGAPSDSRRAVRAAEQETRPGETGCRLETLGELGYYPFSPVDELFEVEEQRCYHEVARAHGIEVSFSPKIAVAQAGSGMHFHTRLMKDGVNQFSQGAGLTGTARRVIGGYLSHAASLTAFGNTAPVSFLRLVPHREAPTSICWGRGNRSVLVRVPLDCGRVAARARGCAAEPARRRGRTGHAGLSRRRPRRCPPTGRPAGAAEDPEER